MTIKYRTLYEYLELLEKLCLKVNTAKKDSIIYLAAAVSDFYIPESELTIHKIQSSDHTNLELCLKPVPKIL